MSRIPMTADVAELIGAHAEGVQNRSLLLDKFVFHKVWGLDELKANDAHRWTLLRLSREGAGELGREAERKLSQSRGRNVEPHNIERFRQESELARKLANTQAETEDAQELRAKHSKRFLELFRSAYGERCRVVIGKLEGRLAINLADGLLQNAGICLDRLLGLPYIPGSAVKGVARHAALRALAAADSNKRPELFTRFRRVFGTAKNDFEKDGALHPFRDSVPEKERDRKGAVAFLPAYPVGATKLAVELTNVHYPEYYRTGKVEDLSKEAPRPNPFPAVEAGASFGFCLVLNGMDGDLTLLDDAEAWLAEGITIGGLGAKTAAGYGWFSIDHEAAARLDAEREAEARQAAEAAEREARDRERKEAEEQRLQAMTPEQRLMETLSSLNQEAFASKAKNLAAEDDATQQAFLNLLKTDKEKRERWKTWKKKKPEIAKVLNDVASKWKIELP